MGAPVDDASIRFPRERSGAQTFKAGVTTKAGYTSSAIKPINMQNSGTVLLAHNADLRASDVDPHTGFDAISDYASFPVRSPAAPASLTGDARTAGGTEETRCFSSGSPP